MVGSIGVEGEGEGHFMAPQHLAVDEERIYVADSGNDRVVVLDKTSLEQVHTIDLLDHPVGVAADDAMIYTVEGGHRDVYGVRAIDKTTFEDRWRIKSGQMGGGADYHFEHLRHVVVDEDYVYVTDGSQGGRVVVVDKHHGYVLRSIKWGKGGSWRWGCLATNLCVPLSPLPHGLAMDPHQPEHLFISFNKSHRIEVVEKTTGRKVRTLKVMASGGKGPYGLAIHGRYLYLTDQHHHRVRVVDKGTGKHIATLGRTGTSSKASCGALGMEDDDDGESAESSSVGASPGRSGVGWGVLSSPSALVLDGHRLYICEGGAHRVQVFSM